MKQRIFPLGIGRSAGKRVEMRQAVVNQLVGIRFLLRRYEYPDSRCSIAKLLVRFGKVQAGPLRRMPGLHAGQKKLAQRGVLLHLQYAPAQMGSGPFIAGICRQLLAKCFRRGRPFFPLFTQQAQAVMQIGEIRVLLHKLLILRNGLIAMSLVGKHIGVELLQVRGIGKLLTALLYLPHSLFAAQHGKQIKQRDILRVLLPCVDRTGPVQIGAEVWRDARSLGKRAARPG